MISLIKLIQSLIKSINLSILSNFGQINFQIYNSILINPQTFNLCCLDLIFKLFFIYSFFFENKKIKL
jgi:hypothetical protein